MKLSVRFRETLAVAGVWSIIEKLVSWPITTSLKLLTLLALGGLVFLGLRYCEGWVKQRLERKNH